MSVRLLLEIASASVLLATADPALAQLTSRASVATDGTEANAFSGSPSISADGRFVAFNSYASNLVSGGTNGGSQVFVRDRTTGTTSLVSVDSNGVEANGPSNSPAISSDGQRNMVQGSSNTRSKPVICRNNPNGSGATRLARDFLSNMIASFGATRAFGHTLPIPKEA